MSRISFPIAAAFAALLIARVSATPVINEIMAHSAAVPENNAQEWIELYNNSPTATFNLTGWQFTKGVDFTFPNGTTLAPGAYLVVAANVVTFQQQHPGFAGTVIGGWLGTLSNSSEHVKLVDSLLATIDEVHYASEGEWGLRARGPLSFSHNGWIWVCDADGAAAAPELRGGKTFELRNPVLSAYDSGQNWGFSAANGGSPGAVNSIASANVAPLIKDVKHKPEIPHSTDPIVVSCNLHDEGTTATAALHWRLDGAGSFNTLAMSDTDGDGDVEATIPAQANLAIVEWYLSATDGTNTRTWPAPARTSDAGVAVETFGQVTNALVLVDNSDDANALFQAPGSQPIYRLIMTNTERAELATIGSTSGQEQSEASMNGTFISHDGTGVDTIYNASFRNRGTGSALGPPNNFHVGFRSDQKWNNRSSMALNCRFPYSQALGNSIFQFVGIPPQEPAIVRARVNGVDLAEAGARMYGRYVRLEGRGGEWTGNHFPNDPDGNFYRLDDHDTGGANPPGDLGSGEFRYEGTDPGAYNDTYKKETNKAENDYTDLVNFCRVVSAPTTGGTAGQPAIADSAYVAALSAVLDIDETYRFFAIDALIGNQEGGLQSGRGDDASLYRGLVDTRFKFLPHDMDSVFNMGEGFAGDPVTRSIFSYDFNFGTTTQGTGVLGLARLFSHPELLPRYYSAVLDGLNMWFTHASLDPVIDQIMAGWVPATNGASSTNDSIAEIKSYIDVRRANVLAQIPQTYSLAVSTGVANTSEGYYQTNTGAATISGVFNVAKTYSITVNGTLAQWFYRPSGSDAAGSWKLVVPAGGGTVLHPGLNKVTARFWSGTNGTGSVLNTLTADVYYSGGSQTGVAANGVPQTGSLGLIAPDSYVPGVPVMVRVDLKDSVGAYDRTVWNATATLTATNGVVLTPSTVTLYNGVGSALVSAGGGGGGTQTLVPAGASWKYKDDGSNQGTAWRAEGFVDTPAWASGPAELGYGDGDEATVVSGALVSPRPPTTYFRTTFNVANPAAFTDLTLTLKYDDAGIVYINGTQVAITAGLSAGVAYDVYATVNTENATQTFTIPASALHAGTNTIACEIHQQAATSSDISFQITLVGNGTAANPGNFTLAATANGLTNSKSLTSLNGVAQTAVSGTLAGANTWSGIIHVTGDVTVPAGASLTIQPGTHVLVDGTSTAGDTTGKKITVNGTITAPGTLASPICITSTDPNTRWGGLVISAAQPTALDYCLISHAGHTATVGHTNKGPMFNITGSAVTLRDCVVGESPGKAMFTSGTTDITIQRSLITHTITGPELQDGTSLLCEDTNIQEILPNYRESNDAVPDDEDCIYIHNGPGRSVLISRCVFAKCGDDVVDCLGGPLTVQDSILRQGWDKGISLLNNDLIIARTQIIDCDKGIALKSNAATTRTVTADHITVSSEEHNTADTVLGPWGYSVPAAVGDADAPATGLWTQNKAGQSNTSAVLRYIVSNSIVEAKIPFNVDAPYPAANTTPIYTCTHDTDTAGAVAWPGTGNIEAMPLFVDGTNKDFHLQTTSPCKNTGDPAAPLDADGSRTDMGALPFGGGGGVGTPTNIIWPLVNSPFHITTDVTIPTGSTLTIEPGVSVQFDQNKKLNVSGTIKALGTANGHVVFSHVPGTVAAGDADPIAPGTQTGPPKWAGIVVTGPSAGPAITGSEFRYCDFIGAQPAVAAGNTGSLGIIRAEALIDHCIFLGTHLRQVYGENCSLQIQYTTFVDPFNPADNNDNPVAYALDNIAEPLKVANANFPANANYTDGMPNGGHFRVWYCDLYGNKGHNDVFDADAGVLGRSAILDCRYNYFHGLTGDEHIDLGGDAYVASNIFERGNKDQWTNDRGYSNAISSGDKGSGTSIWVVRNIAFDVDHMINCKVGTATIFEHNTIASFHADFFYTGTGFTQDVRTSAINLFVPDDVAPLPGDGAYAAYNLFHNMPRIITWADLPSGTTSKLEAANNYLNNITDNSVGPITGTYSGGTQHPGGFTSLGSYVAPGDPLFVDAAGKNYALKFNSPARGSAAGGLDYGASVAEWAYILGGPTATTAATSASFTIGGPGVVAYKWRLDGGAWSAPVTIGTGLAFPRGATPTVRQATLTLNSLTAGAHTLEVLGQDPAGNWQDADPARTVAGLPQAAPTARTWTVDTTNPLVRINEVLADSATLPDTIELTNLGAATVNVGGWTLTDDPLVPAKYTIPANTMLPAGGFLTITATTSLISLDRNGDLVQLRNGAVLVDSVAFGNQIPELTIGRIGVSGAWTLCTPTLGATNVARQLGDPSVVRISEWFSSGDVLYDADWIELANSGALPIDIGGLRITDNRAGDPVAHTFAPLTFIAATGYARFIADANPLLGPSHLAFSLDSQQEEIALFGPTGALLDTIAFFPQTSDYSMGRDASGNLVFYELPTRGFANGTSDPGYVNALALLHGLRITELMFNGIGGSNFDYVELRNVGATTLQLGGVSFVQGITFIFPSMSLAAGQNVLVVKNLASFRARYGNAPLVAGTFTGQLDNGGEVLGLQLPPPFDANVLTFSYSDGWYASTDGLGRSLVVFNPLVKANVWGDRDTWGVSAANGGDPDGAGPRTDTYSGWSALYAVLSVTADDDKDGVAALVEYALGMNPANTNGGHGAAGGPVVFVNASGRAELHFFVPQNASAVQGHGMLEAIYNVQASSDLATWTTIATKTFTTNWSGAGNVAVGSASGGFVPVSVEDTTTGARRFLRLQIAWVP